MGFPEDYAQEVFRELDKRPYKNMHTRFMKAYKKLCEDKDKEDRNNDVGCQISNDCSLHGCYRYSCCDFSEKKKEK